jgi:hypothetical protein
VPGKAGLRRTADPANPLALLPSQLLAHDSEEASLLLYLERFGNVKDVPGQGLTQEATFAHVAQFVETVVQKRVDEAQKRAADEATERVLAFEAAVAQLQSLFEGLAANDAACSALKLLLSLPPLEDPKVEKPKKRASAGQLDEEPPLTLEEKQLNAERAAEAATNALAALESELLRLRDAGPHGFTAVEDVEASKAKFERDAAIASAAKLNARPLKLPNALAFSLAESWNSAETAFKNGAKKALRGLREERQKSVVELHRVRIDSAAFFARPDHRGEVLAAFLDHFNAMPMDMRHDEQVKAELHLRCIKAASGKGFPKGGAAERVSQGSLSDGKVIPPLSIGPSLETFVQATSSAALFGTPANRASPRVIVYCAICATTARSAAGSWPRSPFRRRVFGTLQNAWQMPQTGAL